MMRLTPGTAAGPACGVGWRPILRSGGGAFGGRAVRGQQRRDRGDAGQRRHRRLGGGADRLERAALRRIDLEHEAHAVVLDRQRPHDVGVDDAAAGARHRHRREGGEHVVAGNRHRGPSGVAVCGLRSSGCRAGGKGDAATRRGPMRADARSASAVAIAAATWPRARRERRLTCSAHLVNYNKSLTAMHHAHGGLSLTAVAPVGGRCYLAVHKDWKRS